MKIIDCGKGHGIIRVEVAQWGADITIMREAYWQQGDNFHPAGLQPAESVTVTLGLDALDELRAALAKE